MPLCRISVASFDMQVFVGARAVSETVHKRTDKLCTLPCSICTSSRQCPAPCRAVGPTLQKADPDRLARRHRAPTPRCLANAHSSRYSAAEGTLHGPQEAGFAQVYMHWDAHLQSRCSTAARRLVCHGAGAAQGTCSCRSTCTQRPPCRCILQSGLVWGLVSSYESQESGDTKSGD